MATILLDNLNDSSNEKKQNSESSQSPVNTAEDKTGNTQVLLNPDDFAIFPQWDVIPPNAIINPRLKKNI